MTPQGKRDGGYAHGGVHYLDLTDRSRRNQITITQDTFKRLEAMYADAAKELSKTLAYVGEGSLTERWANEYKKSIENVLAAMRRDEYDILTGGIKRAAENGQYVQLSLFNEIIGTYDLNIDRTFKDTLARVPQQALNELLSGSIYKDGAGLSKRIWRDSQSSEKDIGYIIETAIGAKKSAVKLAEDVEKYVNGAAHTDFDWGNCYPWLRHKKCSYEAQRLARTSISHAYQLATVRGCAGNPYINGIKWVNSNAHERICPRCQAMAEDDRYGLGAGIFPVENVPLDHPNGMCVMLPYLTKSLDDIGKEMKRWVDGESNEALDRWLGKPEKVDIPGNGGTINTNHFAPAKTIKEAESWALENNLSDIVNYKGLDVTTANEFNRAVFDTLSTFPELRPNFRFIGECHERNIALKPIAKKYYLNSLAKANPNHPITLLEPYAETAARKFMNQMKVSTQTMAESWSPKVEAFKPFTGITVNREYGKNATDFVTTLRRTVDSQFHPVGCDVIRSVVDHEIGHQIDTLLDLSNNPAIKQLYEIRSTSQLTNDLSRYAWNNKNPNKYGEMIAEAWAEYKNNPTPRDLAKNLGQIIESEYRMKFGAGNS